MRGHVTIFLQTWEELKDGRIRGWKNPKRMCGQEILINQVLILLCCELVFYSFDPVAS
jgi:hypothetical protein